MKTGKFYLLLHGVGSRGKIIQKGSGSQGTIEQVKTIRQINVVQLKGWLSGGRILAKIFSNCRIESSNKVPSCFKNNNMDFKG